MIGTEHAALSGSDRIVFSSEREERSGQKKSPAFPNRKSAKFRQLGIRVGEVAGIWLPKLPNSHRIVANKKMEQQKANVGQKVSPIKILALYVKEAG